MNPLLLAGLLATFSGDAITTDMALARGGREVILPSQKPLVVTSIVAGEAALAYWSYKKVKPNHPKLAIVLYVTLVGARGAVTLSNIHQLNK